VKANFQTDAAVDSRASDVRPQGTLLINRTDVRQLLTFEDYLKGVEEAFRLYAQGQALKPGIIHVDSIEGEFHIKAGGLELKRRYFGLKVNGGFFQNKKRFGVSNIQGLIMLCDGETGYPLAVMDSRDITTYRTGAATAVAAKYLARPESSVATICGCGNQGRIQLKALASVLPIKESYALSRNQATADAFARDLSEELRIRVTPSNDFESAIRNSDVLVTCTPARRFFVSKGWVGAGSFVAAIGADSPGKQELDPALLMANKVVVDILEQCSSVGELQHAVKLGLPRESVYAELGEIIIGRKLGRVSREEIIIFDSTGTAIQDVAMAVAAFQKAVSMKRGTPFDFQA
jgi:alanine dehydrogenase